MRHNFPMTGQGAVDPKTAYHLLTALVVPRPIAWISSTSADGVDNLAPHSFFTVSSRTPPVVQFTSVGDNDTLKNVRETGEFVVNASPVGLAAQINLSSSNFPRQVSEFDAVGVTREPSVRVRPPRVKEAPSAIECTLNRIIDVGDSWVVLGDVIHVSVKDEVIDSEGDRHHPAFNRLAPLSRLGRNEWGEPGPVWSIERPTLKVH